MLEVYKIVCGERERFGSVGWVSTQKVSSLRTLFETRELFDLGGRRGICIEFGRGLLALWQTLVAVSNTDRGHGSGIDLA